MSRSLSLNFFISACFFIGGLTVSADESDATELKNPACSTTNQLTLRQPVLTGSLIDQKQNFHGTSWIIHYPCTLESMYKNMLQEAADAADLPDDATPGWAKNFVEQGLNDPDSNRPLAEVRNSLMETIGKNAVVAIETSLERRKRSVQMIDWF